MVAGGGGKVRVDIGDQGIVPRINAAGPNSAERVVGEVQGVVGDGLVEVVEHHRLRNGKGPLREALPRNELALSAKEDGEGTYTLALSRREGRENCAEVDRARGHRGEGLGGRLTVPVDGNLAE